MANCICTAVQHLYIYVGFGDNTVIIYSFYIENAVLDAIL